MAFFSSFAGRLYVSVGTVFMVFVALVCLWQYGREREFKVEMTHTRLQMYNQSLSAALGEEVADGRALRRYVSRHRIAGLRVTVIDAGGRVAADSEERDVRRMESHSRRREVREALAAGEGYDIKRHSASNAATYFYSATAIRLADGRQVVVRTAVPYTAALTHALEADYTYLWYAAAMTVALALALWWATRRVARHIAILRAFAASAERGDCLDHELERSLPDDELGDISHNIISLFYRARRSEADKARLKRELTQNAAHELKTPTASIHAFLETLLAHPELPEAKRRHFLERCYAQSERMAHLLLDMSTLTRLDGADDKSRQHADISLPGVITAALADASAALAEAGITPTVAVPDDGATVRGDGELIYSIFRNLIDNAAAYATGATRLAISVAREDKRHFAVRVSDNGAGVSPEHLTHLFERFYRVDKGRSRAAGGTGLGLAIVKNAVRTHGGECRAEPTPGGGLTVAFTLATDTEREASASRA